VPAPSHRDWLSPNGSRNSPSPTRYRSDKSTCSESRTYRILDSPPNSTVLLPLRPTRSATLGTPTAGGVRHWPPSRAKGDHDRPAAQAASGPTGHRPGGRTQKPRAAIAAGARRFAPGTARLMRRAARTGERPLGASRRPGSNGVPGTAGSPGPERLSRAESEACGDRASTAIERSDRRERSAGASGRAARTDRRPPGGGRTRSTGQQRGLAPDLEGPAHGSTGGRPLVMRLWWLIGVCWRRSA
jgi:hypothetical protein